MKINTLGLILLFGVFPAVSQANLTPQIAKKLAAQVLTAAELKGTCIAIAIVDDGSNLLYFERSACAPLGSIETSIQKAKSSSLFRKPTSDFVAAVKAGRVGILTANGVVAVEGGLPIFVKGVFIGAIGIGGATAVEDEEYGKSALKSFETQLMEEK